LRRIDASTRTGGDNFLALQRNLHSGERLGIIGRIVICIVGLLPLLFLITGITMWLKQRRASPSRVERRAHTGMQAVI